MYFLYVDESGDIGIENSPTPFYILSGLVINEDIWHETLNKIVNFRKLVRDDHGLKLREEIHAVTFIQKPEKIRRIPKHIRLKILRETLQFESGLSNLSAYSVVVDKIDKTVESDIFDIAWKTMIQRFENTLVHKNFPNPSSDINRGVIFTDKTDELKLRHLSRKMRKYNPIPNSGNEGYRDIPIVNIIEEPVHKNSLHSYFIQLVDVNAYFLFQKLRACKYIKKQGARNYFNFLDPILNEHVSISGDKGVVYR